MHIGQSLSESYHMCAWFEYTWELCWYRRSHLEKDLGVWTTSNLDNFLQCQKAASAGIRMLDMIKKAFQVMSKDFPLYVWPHLEYYVQIWSPHLAKDIYRSSRKGTDLSLGDLPIYHINQGWKIWDYILFTVVVNRDLIETFKILRGYYNVNCEKLLEVSSTRA